MRPVTMYAVGPARSILHLEMTEKRIGKKDH